MSASRMYAALFVTAMLIGACVAVAAKTYAAGQIWNGRYALVGYAAAKTGTSVAARQPEPDFSEEYVFFTDCSRGPCIATAVGGPRPKNHTLPQSPRYTWDGTRWVQIYDWQWDCYMGEGVPKEWAPAKSWPYLIPQRDGSLRGAWRTDIYGGPCDGTVEMAVAAFPVW
jgi:hypothetical protein